MTAREVYILAASLIGDRENDDQDERHFAIPYLTILLQEALGTENTMRIRDGEPVLDTAQIVASLDDELVYHDVITRVALPYGLAWLYHQEAGNLSLASQYRNMFIDTLESNQCFNVVRKC